MRSGFVAFFVLAVMAMLLGVLPVHATATHIDAASLIAAPVDSAPDALLSADGARPLASAQSVRALVAGATPLAAAPPPASRAGSPSPVRSAHRVDGLSLPLLL